MSVYIYVYSERVERKTWTKLGAIKHATRPDTFSDDEEDTGSGLDEADGDFELDE